MKRTILIISYLFIINLCNGQTQKHHIENEKIKTTIINFLKWYKVGQVKDTTKITDTTNKHRSIIIWESIDTLLKPSIDMVAVEEYMGWFKRSNFVSETFINNLRQYYQKIANDVKTYPPYPKSNGTYVIGGLEADLIFGFEPEEILDHIKEGKFTKIYVIYDKAIIKFDISEFNQYIFSMTKKDGRWFIDYIGADKTNLDKDK